MAVLTSCPLPHSLSIPADYRRLRSVNGRNPSTQQHRRNTGGCRFIVAASQQQQQQQKQCSQFERLRINKSDLKVEEAFSDAELWATSVLRVRSFNSFKPSYGIEDHKKYLAEREFEALKERVAGTRAGFRRVSCINATLPLSQASTLPDDLCSSCKFSNNGEDRVVIGTLDLNQCMSLPDEIIGMKPKGIGADFARAYLSNVCVADECRRNGLGVTLVEMSKLVAEDWGISDLYVHVAVDNEAAKNLYMKCGFTYESEEPAWQARFRDRPRRLLLWIDLPHTYNW